jgi:hypothetical protein
MRVLLLVEGSDFRPSSQDILVSVIPSCFRFVNMCLRQVQPEMLDILLRKVYAVYMEPEVEGVPFV